MIFLPLRYTKVSRGITKCLLYIPNYSKTHTVFKVDKLTIFTTLIRKDDTGYRNTTERNNSWPYSFNAIRAYRYCID